MRLDELKVDPLDKPLSPTSVKKILDILTTTKHDGRSAGLARDILSKWNDQYTSTARLSQIQPDLDNLAKLGINYKDYL